MKGIKLIFLFTLLLYCNLTYGQVDKDDSMVISKSLEDSRITENPIYVDKTVGWERIKKAIKKRRFNNLGKTDSARSLTLTRSEKKAMLDKVAAYKSYIWKEDLLPNSKRIYLDSMWSYLSVENKKHIDSLNDASRKRDTLRLNLLKSKFTWVWGFSKPIYFRNQTICLMYDFTMCGNTCGYDKISFYKRNKGQWEKWFDAESGAY